MYKKGCLIGGGISLAIVLIVGIWLWSTYNSMIGLDEGVKKSWANVENQYQRRSDLIGNLVATVENAADFEKGTLKEVIEARSNANSIKLNVEDLNEANIKKFQESQEALNQSFLGRMNFLNENYPQLTATQQFKDLSAEITGTENRVNLARDNYNEEVQNFNIKIRSFPQNIFAVGLGFTPKASFKSTAGSEKAPNVREEFNK